MRTGGEVEHSHRCRADEGGSARDLENDSEHGAILQKHHLHDNTRAHAVFDPANPGLTTYVRVTRRVNTNRDEEVRLQQARKEATRRDLEWEAKDQQELDSKVAAETAAAEG